MPVNPPRDLGCEAAPRGEIRDYVELIDEFEMLMDRAKTILHLASEPERFAIKLGDDPGVRGEIGADRPDEG
jgi:hypothetical protein